MKKTILIETLLLFLLAVIISVCVQEWKFVDATLLNLNDKHLVDIATPDIIETWKNNLQNYYIYAIFTTIAGLLDVLIIILVIITDFPVFKLIHEKTNERKIQRAQAKAETAEANKQRKIMALEAQLEELKKDGK